MSHGRVRDIIIKDAFARGYNASISIEPHMAVVFQYTHAKATNDGATRANFVECDQRLEQLMLASRVQHYEVQR